MNREKERASNMTSGVKKILFTVIGAILAISFSKTDIGIIAQQNNVAGTQVPFSLEAYYNESLISYYEALNMIITSDKPVYVTDGNTTREYDQVSVNELFNTDSVYFVENSDYLCIIDDKSVTLVEQGHVSTEEPI